MITIDNYFKKAKELKRNDLPADLKEGYDYVKELTEDHTTWDYYKSDNDIKAAVDEYLANLSEFLVKKEEPKKKTNVKGSDANIEKQAREAAKDLIRDYVKRGDELEYLQKSHLGFHGSKFSAQIEKNKIRVKEVEGIKVEFSFPLHSIYNEILEEENITPEKPAPKAEKVKPKKAKKSVPEKSNKSEEIPEKTNQVERITEEVRFIKRYALMDGKIKTDSQILNFINSLQKAIMDRRIRKTSPYAKDIEYIQTNLLKLYNVMGKKVEIKINEKILDQFLEIAGSEKVRLSITYLKRYIGIQGKKITKEKAQRLITLLQKAVSKKAITKDDPYAVRLNTAFESLDKFVKSAKRNDTLEVHPSILNGIESALGCCCDDKKKGLEGIDAGLEQPVPAPALEPPKNAVMNSLDFAKLKFDTLGFDGKWLELIGDPCEGFTAMVFGRPKMGKSYLCIDFAGYLARHHGNTLYVAKEEKLDATLQKKLDDKNVKHPCLFVSDHLPNDLSNFRFIILDSVNKLSLQPEDLERLKANNPGKSFIYVFQTTKEGNFRGANTFQHDVDVVIEVPEKGKAIQFGRFNQGGEMEIFGNDFDVAA